MPRQRPVVRAAVALALLMLGGCGASGGVDGSGAPAPKVIRVTLPAPDFGGELWLSALGLYGDIGTKELAPDLIAFEPTYALWADGAEKLRWLRLPEGKTIDTSDMDHWVFPVGTYAFKEFTRGGKRMETRVIARTGPGPEDYWLGAFAWKDDESDALIVPGGRPNVRGTAHDIPKVSACGTCHKGEGGRILGYSSVQQPDAPAALVSKFAAACVISPAMTISPVKVSSLPRACCAPASLQPLVRPARRTVPLPLAACRP